MKLILISISIILVSSSLTVAQQVEKVDFGKDYYLAVTPPSGKIDGVLVLLRSFGGPEIMIPETNLPNVAAINNILTILLSTRQKFYADTATVNKLNQAISHVIQKYKADTSKFAIGGYDYAGTIALRYAELAQAGGSNIPVVPKAVFTADSPTDLFNFWNRCEEDIRKDFYAATTEDAKFILEKMKSENGDIHTNAERYKELSPFMVSENIPGNEQLLKNMSVRVYYDTDINWQLANRRNSFYDTNIPDGSELIKRLLLAGNQHAAFIAARPGMRPDGTRNPNAFSIVEEMDCMRWLKKSMDIFDPYFWVSPYHITVPKGWGKELMPLPPDFAPSIPFKGVEELSFSPGWGNSNTAEYWTYSYTWLLDGKQSPDENALENILALYYDGLVKRNIEPRKIPANIVFPTAVKIRKDKTGQKYTGTIHMLDYMAQKPMTLNCIVVKKDCNLPDKTVLFIKVSPQSLDQPVWKKMNDIDESLRCDK